MIDENDETQDKTTSFDARRTSQEDWKVIDAQPFSADWVNVYDLGDRGFCLEPCPAILIQQSTLEICSWDEQVGDKIVRKVARLEHDPWRRAVFAAHEYGELIAANDASNYVTTTTREKWFGPDLEGTR